MQHTHGACTCWQCVCVWLCLSVCWQPCMRTRSGGGCQCCTGTLCCWEASCSSVEEWNDVCVGDGWALGLWFACTLVLQRLFPHTSTLRSCLFSIVACARQQVLHTSPRSSSTKAPPTAAVPEGTIPTPGQQRVNNTHTHTSLSCCILCRLICISMCAEAHVACINSYASRTGTCMCENLCHVHRIHHHTYIHGM